MIDLLGSVDAVEERSYGSRRTFAYKCCKCSQVITDKLWPHLVIKHDYLEEDARMEQSRMRVLFLWSRSDKHNCPLPAPCEKCHEWFLRLDHHLKNKHELSANDQSKVIEQAKSKHWKKGFLNEKNSLGNPSNIDFLDRENEEFVVRSQPKKLAENIPSADYIPEHSFKLSNKLRERWEIRKDDHFQIFYDNPDTLLDAFEGHLKEENFRADNSNASQHRMYVELIWRTISPELVLFPENALNNFYLLKKYYHTPSMQAISLLIFVVA